MNKKLMGIYQIRNLANGKIYIGSSVDIKRRWGWHKSALRGNRHDNIHLQRAWNKYGEESFEFSVLCIVFNKKNLLFMEQKYIDEFSPKYNISKYAGFGNLGLSFSEEHKQKISIALSGRVVSKRTRNKLSKVLSGRVLSDSHKKNMSKSRKGESNPFHKLSWKDVKEIRKLFKNKKYTQKKLGELYNVSSTTIQGIVHNKAWIENT